MDSRSLILIAAEASDDRKAKNTKLVKIEKVSTIADWILITEGLSDVQVRAIANNIESKIKTEAGFTPLRKEGLNEGKWALLDYGDVIINIFQSAERAFYDLEGFWSNGEISDFEVNNLTQ